MPVVGGFKHALVSDGTGLNVDNLTPADVRYGPIADIGHSRTVCLGSPFDPRVDLTAERGEINRLGEKRISAAFQSFGFGLGITIGSNHDDWHYLVIKPQELERRLEKLHGLSKRYQVYVWVTKHGQAWLTRGMVAIDREGIAQGTFKNTARDVTRHLNDWSAVKEL
jgi:hypothetical protein